MKKDFLPVIVGTDMNAYYVARCFHEAYHLKSALFGKNEADFTKYSNLFSETIIEPNFWNSDVFASCLINFAKKQQENVEHLILVGTNDIYVRLIIENTEALRPYYDFNYIDASQLNHIMLKDQFYQLCQEEGLDIPETYVVDCGLTEPEIPTITKFPVIIKPSDNDAYYRHSFLGQEKVYKLNSQSEIEQTISEIQTHGYDGKLILQDFIPGDDSSMYDSVFYANQKGEVEFISFAQVLLQEHNPALIGGYTVLMTRENDELVQKLKAFVEKFHYVGFGNFDIKYDRRDGKFKLFEVNIRQGKCSYYVTACGYNLMTYLVDDLLYQKSKNFEIVRRPMILTYVPVGVIKKYIQDPTTRQEALALAHEGKLTNPMVYKADKNLTRKLFNFVRGVNYYRKYKKFTSW